MTGVKAWSQLRTAAAVMAALAGLLAAPARAVEPPASPATPVFRACQIYVWCNREKFANPSESEQFFFCMGYVIATVEARLTARTDGGAAPCLPAEVYGSQFIDMAVAYMRRHPDRLNEPAPRLILDAFYEAHPACR